MSDKDYAKYILDNMGRASCTNVFKIAEKYYNNKEEFKDMLKHMQEACIGHDNYQRIYTLCATKLKDIETVPPMWVMNEFVLELWEIFNGTC